MKKAFTLIELIITFVIISLIATVGYKVYAEVFFNQIGNSTKSNLNSIATIEEAEHEQKGIFTTDPVAVSSITNLDEKLSFTSSPLGVNDLNKISIKNIENTGSDTLKLSATDSEMCYSIIITFDKSAETYSIVNEEKLWYNGCGL